MRFQKQKCFFTKKSQVLNEIWSKSWAPFDDADAYSSMKMIIT